MSCTQISGLTKNRAYRIGEVRNSWRGAMAIWTILEDKYLPKFIPEWAKSLEEKDYSDYSRSYSGNDNDMKQIWDLSNSDKLTFNEKIVLCSTFDNVLVRVESIDKVLKAFREFDDKTSLKEQANIIEKALKENQDIIAIGWNQTSVCEDKWVFKNYDEEKNEWFGYNLEENKDHWFLFDELK